MRNKSYNVKAYALDGTFKRSIGPSEIMDAPRFTAQLSGGQGELSLRLNLPFDSTAVAYNDVLRVYQNDDTGNVGRLVYSGIITSIRRVSDKYAEYVEVRALGLASLLSRTLFSSGWSYAFNRNQDPAATIREIVDDFATKYPVSYGVQNAYYPFDGNANDASGNGHNGTVTGATLTTDKSGVANRAYSFDGNDRIDVPGVYAGMASQWTIQALIYATSFGASQVRRIIIPTNDTSYTVALRTTWSIEFAANDGAWKVIAHTPTPSFLNRWAHVAMTYGTDGKIKWYVDGAKVGEIQMAGPITMGTDAYIGNWSTLAQWFIGKIDEVRFHPVAFDEAEIARQAANALANAKGLVKYDETSIENAGTTSNVDFNATKASDAIANVAQTATGRYWTVDASGTVQFHPQTGAIGQRHHYLTVGKDVEEIEVDENVENLCNAVALEYAGWTVTYVDAASVAAYGRRETRQTRTDIADASTANAAAQAYVDKNKEPKRKIRIKVNSSYDIETIRPGDLVTVRNTAYSVSALIIARIGYNGDDLTADLEDYDSFGPAVLSI